jgi:hypothetical protein
MMKQTYILMRNNNYRPDGPVRLGSVLSSPTTPESTIGSSTLLPFPESIPIQVSSLYDFKSTCAQNSGSKFGVFTKFLSVLGIGADVGVETAVMTSHSVSAEKLETRFIAPTRDYLELLLQVPAIQEYIKEQRFRANIYLVTGIRVAFGVREGSSSAERKSGVHVSARVDGSMTGGVPASVGPEVTIDKGQKVKMEFGKSDDYVYAYRVKEVHYSTRKGKVVSKDIKGELYSLDRKGVVVEKNGEADDEHIILEVDDMGQEWLSARAMRSHAVEGIDDDGAACEIVMP